MKRQAFILLFSFILLLFHYTHTLVHGKLLAPYPFETVVYGPLPLGHFQGDTDGDDDAYHFNGMKRGFGKASLDRIGEISKKEFRQTILSALPLRLRPHLKKYLVITLQLAEEYQVDPFWVLAVMWSESHFNPQAVSLVSAQGLMQIMPYTGYYLFDKIANPVPFHLARELAKDPKMNIEMGVFYLKHMLSFFKGNYKLATIAYNMGPFRVKKRLRYNLPVGVQNQYLDRVREKYRRVARLFIQDMKRQPFPYESTYVISSRRQDPLTHLVAMLHR